MKFVESKPLKNILHHCNEISATVTHHLFVDISSHGSGHLAQTAPVLNALRRKLPALRLTIRSGLPRERLALRIEGQFDHIPDASDFGLVMKSALDVDRAASLARYRELHGEWDTQVHGYAALLTELQPDWMLVNISYLALAAAARAKLPATALCSLNWAEIFYPYCADAPDAAGMRDQMLAAYNLAETFLRLTPGMEMPEIAHLRRIEPIAQQGVNRHAQLQQALTLNAHTRLVLVAMGGVHLALSAINWPRHPDLCWIVPRDAGLQRDDMIFVEDIERDMGLTFNDLLASCDCVMTKSGYGTFVEASVAATPVLHVVRPDWPEETVLTDWLHQHNHAIAISRDQFEQGAFAEAVWRLASGARATPLLPSGIAQVADYLFARLTSPQKSG